MVGGRATIGPLSYKYNTDFDVTTYHEMGHLLEGHIKYTKGPIENVPLNMLNQCLESQHTEIKAGDKRTASQYTTEDFADWAAAQMAERPQNFFCYLLNGDSASQKTVLNENSDDSHSSDLFRVMHVFKIKTKTLPASCLASLKSEGLEDPYRTCE